MGVRTSGTFRRRLWFSSGTECFCAVRCEEHHRAWKFAQSSITSDGPCFVPIFRDVADHRPWHRRQPVLKAQRSSPPAGCRHQFECRLRPPELYHRSQIDTSGTAINLSAPPDRPVVLLAQRLRHRILRADPRYHLSCANLPFSEQAVYLRDELISISVVDDITHMFSTLYRNALALRVCLGDIHSHNASLTSADQ